MAYIDDLRHHRVPLSNLETVTDLYTDDVLFVQNFDRTNTVHISGGNDTVAMLGISDDVIFDDAAANARPIQMPDGTLVIPPGTSPSGDDIVHAGGGRDTIVAGDGVNVYDGAAGIDTVDFSRASGDVIVNLSQGIAVGYGYDTLLSIENIVGSSHDDIILGSDVDNVLNGGDGNDTLLGGVGADTLIGGRGIDTIVYGGSPAGVTINLATGFADGGDAHGDTFSGIENVTGSSHADRLTGDANDNRLVGGEGRDFLTGGLGRDTFAFYRNDSPPDHADVITDFKPGEDKIDLSGLTAMVHGGWGQQEPPPLVLVESFSGAANEVMTTQGQAITLVLADLDGDKVADFAIQLNGSLHLTANDFIL